MRKVNSSGSFDEIYYYHDGTLIAKNHTNTGGVSYYHPDHLGSTTLVTNEAGDVVEETTYYPYGDTFDGGDSRYLYTGKEEDSTGLYYYGARYYSPSVLRRFTQADSLIPNIYNPQDLNRYSYVRNNPYKYVDPDGNQAIEVEGSLEYGIVYKSFFAREFRARQARGNLKQELKQKYEQIPRSNSVITCVGCGDSFSFTQLQEIELRNEFQVVLEEEEIINYRYRDEELTSRLDVMRMDYGFDKSLVRNEINYQYKQETGRDYYEDKPTLRDRFRSFFSSVTHYIVTKGSREKVERINIPGGGHRDRPIKENSDD